MPTRYECVIAEICWQEQILLQRQSFEDPLDAGQWRYPATRLIDAIPRAHAAFCGVEARLSAALQTLLDGLGIELKHIDAIETLAQQQSPAWHPVPLAAHILRVRLHQHAAPAASEPRERWSAAGDWLARHATGRLLLNPLTRLLLEAHGSGNSADWASQTLEEPLGGLEVWPIRSHTLPPAKHTNAFVFGDEPRLLVDPSPCDETAYQELSQRLQAARIDTIFITHHHPDHHQQANRLAREHELPVICSADTAERIPRRFGKDYWDGIPVHTAGDGEQVGVWQQQPVLAHAVPGHDEGQLALAPADGSWMIVGDLIQGIGTVVIAEPEGHMGRYLASLRKVIDMAPDVILPSHGQAMGSTYRIASTLAHRELREEQIYALHDSGASIDQMLEQIYTDVDRRLWGLARMNIVSHLNHLKETGRIH